MSQATQAITPKALRRFELLTQLSEEDLQELLRTSLTNHLSPKTPVFRKDDSSKRTFFLIQGEVLLYRSDGRRTLVSAGTSAASMPLGAHIPGQVAAIAHSEAVLLSFDADMLDLFVSWSHPGNLLTEEVTLDHDLEWTKQLLQSRGLLRFSETQIKNLLNSMQEIQFYAGDTIIHQDDIDDYYYIIKHGRCQVSRSPEPNSRSIRLAELGDGDAFGEEALLTNTPRTATVTMVEDGSLMRLSKKDFAEFLANPLLNSVAWEESKELVLMGATFIDVRLPEEYARRNIPGSVNVPLSLLRLRIDSLSKHRKYIVYCDSGSRSAVAAFLLSRHGIDAYILDGGLDGVQQPSPAARPSQRVKSNYKYHYTDSWGDTVDYVEDTTAPQPPISDVVAFPDNKLAAKKEAAAEKAKANNRVEFIFEAKEENGDSPKRSWLKRLGLLSALLMLAGGIATGGYIYKDQGQALLARLLPGHSIQAMFAGDHIVTPDPRQIPTAGHAGKGGLIPVSRH